MGITALKALSTKYTVVTLKKQLSKTDSLVLCLGNGNIWYTIPFGCLLNGWKQESIDL